jgi:hypothetical protein
MHKALGHESPCKQTEFTYEAVNTQTRFWDSAHPAWNHTQGRAVVTDSPDSR